MSEQQQEQQQDPHVARYHALQERWHFLRNHADNIRYMADEHKPNSKQHTDAVIAELAVKVTQ